MMKMRLLNIRRNGSFLGKGTSALMGIWLLISLLGCATRVDLEKPLAKKGEKLFTQFSFFYENGKRVTTNYRRGILVSVNTPVEFVEATSGSITVDIPTYETRLRIQNIKDYSGEDIRGIFNRTFARKKVDLSSFNELERENILRGTVSTGMSKEAVILAMGYPPQHHTPSLSMNQWRYWQSRLDTILVYFHDEAVTEIKD